MELDLRQIFRAGLRWAWLIVLSAVLLGTIAYVVTSGQTATYSATTTILVNPQQVSGTVDINSLQASRSQAETYVRLVASGPVLDRVINELDLQYTRGELTEKINAEVVRNTQLIEITVSDASPEVAAQIANSVATQFEAQVQDLTIGRLEDNLTNLNSEISALETRQGEINAQLAQLDTEANADDAGIQQQVGELQQERTRTQETLADLQANIRSINQQLATMTSPVEVADEALAAREPDSPRPRLMTALGVFLGLLIGVGIAATLEFMDNKVRQDTDIEELTDSRLLVTIPNEKATPGAPYVVAHPESQASEGIRMLRTRLGALANAGSHSAIVFAGAGGATPTSEIVANLGVVMAQAGLRTVIIDANLRSPRQHQLFGISNDSGLASTLATTQNHPEGIDATTVAPRLSVITAGESDGPSGELLASAAFSSLLGSIRKEANVVLIDAPEAISASDALSMATVADGVVLVTRYGSTTLEDLVRLSETMHQDGICLIGVAAVRK